MEDVIFSGSDARKPTAAAEVRLRFSGVLKTVSGPAFPAERARRRQQRARRRPMATATARRRQRAWQRTAHGAMARSNGNGPEPCRGRRRGREELIQSVAREVEVTRRLYRSGESEYLIDGQSCRLRDVHDLLMDTGLGAKAYAIIEQGKIGLILSSRPTDRRQLIEEAAGVTKYKARRRAAELKLDAAQQNLTRIDDIVFEVEKQRGTLKRQAAKARRYQRLRDELRRWEKVLFARKYRQLAEAIESARGAPGRRARARSGRSRRASPRSKSTLGRAAHRAGRGRGARDRGARGGARARAGDQPPAAADRVRPRAGAGARGTNAPAHRRRSSRRSRRGASRRAWRWRRAARRRADGRRRPRARRGRAGRRIGRLRSRAPRDRGARGGRRSGAQRGLLRDQLGDRAAPRARACGDGARSRRRDAVASWTSKPTTSASSPSARRGRPRRPRAEGLRRAQEAHRGDAHRARGPRVGAGQRAHRARVARRDRCARREQELAGPRGAADVARGARGRARRLRRRARAPCSRRPTARSTSRARSPTTSRSRRATSAPSRPASAICCSTSSSSGPSTPPPAFSWCGKQGAGRCGFLVIAAATAPVAAGAFTRR